MSQEDMISQIKKCVSFIYRFTRKGGYPIGTGFWVWVPKEGNPKKQLGYFVTAKHVLLDKNGEFVPQMILRHGTLDGSLKFITIEINPDTILTHSDNDVDIAVIQTVLNPKIYDFKGIPVELISTNESVKDTGIREGDNVFFSGLFSSFPGAEKNHPIFRFGKVALLTDEKIAWKENDTVIMIRLYLIECQSFGGNSGAPVFLRLIQMSVETNLPLMISLIPYVETLNLKKLKMKKNFNLN